jgi:hypothetical protein
MNKVDKFMAEALDEMFKRVGFEGFDKEFTNQENWYSKKSWTKEDSEKYREWFVNRFAKTFKCHKSLAEKEFCWFNLMWGWKVDE